MDHYRQILAQNIFHSLQTLSIEQFWIRSIWVELIRADSSWFGLIRADSSWFELILLTVLKIAALRNESLFTMHKYEGHKTSYTTSTFSATLINSYHFGWTYSTYLRLLPLCSSFANSNLIKSKVALSEWILTSIFLRFFLKVKGELNCKGWKLVVSLNNEQKLKGNKSLVTPKVVEKSSMMVSQRKSAMTIIFSQKPNYMYCSGQLLNTL